ncbi:MAG: hypothetical protein ACE5HU_01045, partial [Acidobacteriota bacterium]
MRRSSGGPPGRRQRRAATGPDARDFQLETRHLAFLIALVVALCIASFMLGRWVERQSLGAEVPGLTM